MPTCQKKKGLFVLRECRRPTNTKCTSCSKDVCSKHSRDNEEGRLLCMECYVQDQKSKRKDLLEDEYERWEVGTEPHYYLWYYTLRHDFYHDSSYSPFDESDYGGFDAESMTEYNDDSDAGGFFDS